MDIILALVIAGCQALATWLAWRATATPLKPHQRIRKKRYSAVLGISCFVGFGATGFVTYNSRDVSKQLGDVQKNLRTVQNQLGEAQKNIRDLSENFVVADIPKSAVAKDENGASPTTPNTEITTPSAASNDTKFQVEKVEAINTDPSASIRLNVYVKNVGLPVKNLLIYSNADIAETATDAKKQKKIISELSRQQMFTHAYRIPGNAQYEIPMYVRKNERFWFTQIAPNVSSDMIAGLKQGKYSIYFVGVLGTYSYCFYVTGDLGKVHECFS
jgi:hypothetical protein